ncbi:hypothetical protein GY45DRAFT_1328235 [Cubamyces sp. BRFM 1775]|nr:hypothetical protein GY45DRAFT_1328235 [Cubamyces sp. BRFM 1775]
MWSMLTNRSIALRRELARGPSPPKPTSSNSAPLPPDKPCMPPSTSAARRDVLVTRPGPPSSPKLLKRAAHTTTHPAEAHVRTRMPPPLTCAAHLRTPAEAHGAACTDT